jgi:long-subunit fatty acid transport protein
MKKIMMTLAAVAVAATMNAQGYVGGNIGFSNSTDKTSAAAEVTSTGFAIAPEFGYKLDDKMAVGIALGFGYTNNKIENTTTNPTTSVESKVTTFSIKPYLRYQCLTAGNFNVFVDGGLNFASQSQKDMKAAMDFGLFVSPGIAYNVSEKWSIVAHLNDMFTFGYSKKAIPDVAGAPDAPSSISAGLSTGGFNLGSLTFGVYYNF